MHTRHIELNQTTYDASLHLSSLSLSLSLPPSPLLRSLSLFLSLLPSFSLSLAFKAILSIHQHSQSTYYHTRNHSLPRDRTNIDHHSHALFLS